MSRIIIVAGIAVILGCCLSFSNTGAPAPGKESTSAVAGKEKWRKLFDGKTTKGWHTYGKTTVGSCWQVEDGALHLVPVTDPQNEGDLVTDEAFDNFHLKLDWKVAAGSNSGVIFLVHEDTARFKATYHTGLEMQVLDNIGAEDNKKENHLAGTLYDLAGTAALSKPKPVGQWNTSEIICSKGKLQLILNGTTVVSTTLWNENWNRMVAGSKFKSMPAFSTFKRGKIALQYHGGELWYRNISILEN